MDFIKKHLFLLCLLCLVLIINIFLFFRFSSKNETAAPKEIKVAGKVKIKYPQDFTIVLLGDSMTERLGNADEIRANLKKYYPKKSFEVLNYGFGSTNILSAQERLEKETFYSRKFRPILDIAFDLILIESFGNNPLSQFPLTEGLQKQTQALDKIVSSIKRENPKAKIAFISTIAPNKRKYGEGAVALTLEQKDQWVKERVAYIKNHMEYARTRGIPLIDVFEKSLNNDNDGKLDYLDEHDFIHPSPSGIILISGEIADQIFKQKILPL